MAIALQKYSGCLLGGAIGDALGAPIEFMSLSQIRAHYGPHGVADYVESNDGRGWFTDDTQMTLFTAEGLLRARHRAMLKGIGGALTAITYQSYLRWLYTQGRQPAQTPAGMGVYDVEGGWLIKEKGLFVLRAPGNTCLGALQSGRCGTIDQPLNQSKGCGGIMRVAPVGLVFHADAAAAFRVGCELAAITHSHPSGYLSAGCLAAIIALLAEGESLPGAVDATVDLLKRWPEHQETLQAIEAARSLYQNADLSAENVERLGGGWVGEESLSISLFCALHSQTDFRRGVLAAVNHSGDGDSTGAISGNILGVMLGQSALPAAWLDGLQLADVVERVAVDLHTGVKGNSYRQDPAWTEKYPPY